MNHLRLFLEKAFRIIYKVTPYSVISPVERNVFNLKGTSL